MQKQSDELEELITLADAYCSGQITSEQMARLERTLEKSQNRQAYIEYLDIHSELSFARQSSLDLTPLLNVLPKTESQSRRSVFWTSAMMTCALAVVLVIGVQSFLSLPKEKIAILAMTSTDAEWAEGEQVPGDILRIRDELSLKSGTASLAFETGALVHLKAPVAIKLTGRNSLSMSYGQVLAEVPGEARGFTVRTEDALVVDLGTKFTVHKQEDQATEVVMQQGRASVQLLDRQGKGVRELDLSAGQAIQLDLSSRQTQLVDYLAALLGTMQTNHGLIDRFTGVLRLTPQPPATLASGQLETRNHALCLLEQTVIFEDDVFIDGYEERVLLPKNKPIFSYLIHYNPPTNAAISGAGSITFRGKILAVLVTSSELSKTDHLFAIPGCVMPQEEVRGLEVGNDRFQVSEDRRTLSVHFDVDPPVSIDEIRVLVEAH